MFGGFCPRGIVVRGIIKRERDTYYDRADRKLMLSIESRINCL